MPRSPKPPPPDRARHGGVADEADHRNRETRDDAGHRFGEEHLRDDLQVRRPHRLGGFDEALVDFAEARLDHARDEGRNRERERHDRRGGADRRAHDHAREGDDRHQENDEGDRAHRVDDGAQGDVQHRHRQEALLVGDEEHDPERNPREGAHEPGHGHHDDRFDEGVADQGQEVSQHRRVPPRSRRSCGRSQPVVRRPRGCLRPEP